MLLAPQHDVDVLEFRLPLEAARARHWIGHAAAEDDPSRSIVMVGHAQLRSWTV